MSCASGEKWMYNTQSTPRMFPRSWLALCLTIVLAAAGHLAGYQATTTIKGPVTEVSTDHLLVRYANAVNAGLDGSASLALDIVPRPRMHVYAPGADDYQIIRVSVSKQPGVRVRPMKYPQSEIYFFEPLNERIPVYQKPFRLAVDLLVDAGSGSRSPKGLKVNGQLEYQACDDKVCFAPVTVGLEWVVLR
jgi:hypothetical protein